MAAPRTGCSFRGTVGNRNRLVMLFCAIGLVIVAANIKLILDLTGVAGGQEISTTMSPSEGAKPEYVSVAQLAQQMRVRLSVVVGLVIVCFGAMIYLLVSRVVVPLRAMARAVEEMTNGNLSVAAPSLAKGEIGELGQMINDLAVNFQEVLLLTGTAAGNSCAAVERIQQALERDTDTDRKELKEQVKALKEDLEMLGTMVKDFQFYQTRFDGQKVVARRSRTEG